MAGAHGHSGTPSKNCSMPDQLGPALERIYRGQANVAKEAKKMDMTTEELKRVFRLYALERPADLQAWEEEEHLRGRGLDARCFCSTIRSWARDRPCSIASNQWPIATTTSPIHLPGTAPFSPLFSSFCSAALSAGAYRLPKSDDRARLPPRCPSCL